MGKTKVPLPVEVGLLRICAQGLVGATAAANVTAAVEALLAVQGQQVSALPHALLARCPQASGSDVTAAFDDGLLVRHRPMRGTVHITTAADYHWLRQTLQADWSAWDARHYHLAGIDQQVTDNACEIAWQAIAEGGGKVSRAALYQAWRENLDTTHLENESALRQWCRWLMYRTMGIGAIVEGPCGRNQHLFVDARALPAATSAQSTFQLAAEDREAGLVEVARRYIRGHGPVTLEDLCWWAGMRKTTALAALEAAVEQDPTLGRYFLEGNELRPEPRPAQPRQTSSLLYMRRDLPEILQAHRKAALDVMFLPAFDELYVGYANRTCLCNSDGDHLICPARNGMFRPLIVGKGRLVGVRPADGEVLWMGKPSRNLVSRVEKQVTRTLDRLQA